LLELFRALAPDADARTIVDCTLGGGGHTRALLDALAAEPALRRHKVVAVDQDPEAISRASDRFAAEIADGRLELVHARFGELAARLAGRPVYGLMADLGFSSDQIDDMERGLSFKSDGPLDMRLDPTRGRSCRDLLADIGENELADLIYELGEDRFSRRIAQAIVSERRARGVPQTAKALAEVIWGAYPPPARHKSRIHPATRTFQALRIAVNEELEELDRLLSHVLLLLDTGGRAAILTFHSLEDRRVKRVFKERGGRFRQLTKKPIEPEEDEVRTNPRSRSAKLRVAERVSQNECDSKTTFRSG
jgi:16S rRNA (cytosine1402-N4)-methyltransferase